MISSVRRPRSWNDCPSASNSASDHPTPTAIVSRPALSASRLASAFASQSGLCWGTTSTLVPSPTRSVTAAADASVSSGSKRYGDGYDCAAGCTTWSLTQTSANPSSSA